MMGFLARDSYSAVHALMTCIKSVGSISAIVRLCFGEKQTTLQVPRTPCALSNRWASLSISESFWSSMCSNSVRLWWFSMRLLIRINLSHSLPQNALGIQAGFPWQQGSHSQRQRWSRSWGWLRRNELACFLDRDSTLARTLACWRPRASLPGPATAAWLDVASRGHRSLSMDWIACGCDPRDQRPLPREASFCFFFFFERQLKDKQ